MLVPPDKSVRLPSTWIWQQDTSQSCPFRLVLLNLIILLEEKQYEVIDSIHDSLQFACNSIHARFHAVRDLLFSCRRATSESQERKTRKANRRGTRGG